MGLQWGLLNVLEGSYNPTGNEKVWRWASFESAKTKPRRKVAYWFMNRPASNASQSEMVEWRRYVKEPRKTSAKYQPVSVVSNRAKKRSAATSSWSLRTTSWNSSCNTSHPKNVFPSTLIQFTFSEGVARMWAYFLISMTNSRGVLRKWEWSNSMLRLQERKDPKTENCQQGGLYISGQKLNHLCKTTCNIASLCLLPAAVPGLFKSLSQTDHCEQIKQYILSGLLRQKMFKPADLPA